MTKGAIYSNFPSKGALLLAAVAAKGLILSKRGRSTTLREELGKTARELVNLVRRAKGEELFIAQFQLYALGDAELMKEIAATYTSGFASTSSYLASLKGMESSGMRPDELAVALQAIALGFTVQSFFSPDAITKSVVEETFQALAAGLCDRRAH